MTPWETPRTADMMDKFLADDSAIEDALGLIPSMFGVSDKATYLGYRSLGFNPKQCLQIMELDEDELDYWNQDKGFQEVEKRFLNQMQTEISAELIRLGFLKNMAMFVAKDAGLIRKSLLDMDMLSKREYDYLMKVRTHYTPGDLLSLEKALNPDKQQGDLVINLQWGPHQALEGASTPYQLIEGEKSNGNDADSYERIPLSYPEVSD